MPIYEYECPQCGNVFEEWGKASEPHHLEPCPVCGAESPRVISRTSFVLKGDGWYVSDYGYRKGIKDDAGGVADTPLPRANTAPAKQGEKGLAVKKDATPDTAAKKAEPKSAPKAQDGSAKTEAATAAAPAAPKADKSGSSTDSATPAK